MNVLSAWQPSHLWITPLSTKKQAKSERQKKTPAPFEEDNDLMDEDENILDDDDDLSDSDMDIDLKEKEESN